MNIYVNQYRNYKETISRIVSGDMLTNRPLAGYLKFLSLAFILFFFTACNSKQNKNRQREKIMTEGATLFSKYGCMVCHSLDGSELYGPALDDIYMKEIRVVRDGNEITVTADRDYIRKAITDPRHEKVLEYKEKEMPMTFLNDEEIEILVEYIVESNKKDNKTELP